MNGTRAMKPLLPHEDGLLSWGNGVVSMVFDVSEGFPVRLRDVSGCGMETFGGHGDGAEQAGMERDPQPIVEVHTTGTGSQDNRLTLVTGFAGGRLRFVSAAAEEPMEGSDDPYRLEITQFASYDALEPKRRGAGRIAATSMEDGHDDGSQAIAADPAKGLVVVSVFEAFPGLSAVRTYTRLAAERRLSVEAVSSLNLTVPVCANGGDLDRSHVLWGDSAWAVENDWRIRRLRDVAVRDRNLTINPGRSSSRFVMHSSSTWSTGLHEPAGIVQVEGSEPRSCGFSVMWEIEHNGPWEWEIGEDDPGLRVSAFGPEYQDHQWYTRLGEGNDFESVPVSFAIVAGDWQRSVAEMTLQRRALRAAKARELGRADQLEHTQGLVVYNDYMNTLFGDPRLESELPLIEGAAKAGADVFCIDAGWYDSTDGGWWNMVGEWEPSTNRFGEIGLGGLARIIRDHGMGLGLWLEPEVIGMDSPLAQKLPDSAFFQRHGERVGDSGRYLLDFRSSAARAHVTETVDRLIDDFNVAFFKFDYNTIPGVGTDAHAESVGDGLLGHCRAYLDWLDDLRRRHPDVTIENCGSGAMRADYAQLQRLDLQSTSDQCDPLIYAAIAAGAGMTILPEQQGNWGYAQQEMDDETAVFTLATGILGRLYLSGFINHMDETRLALVRDAVALHRRVLAGQRDLVPFWPAGLPDFNGEWLVSGLRRSAKRPSMRNVAPGTDDCDYITVWHRGGNASTMSMPLPAEDDIRQVFPDPSRSAHAPGAKPWTIERLDSKTIRFDVGISDKPSARIFAIRHR